jgi:hypothetical protein
MESLTASIFAALPTSLALAPSLLGLLAITATAVGLMLLLAQTNGQDAEHPAKLPAADLLPALGCIASHEPSFRSLTGRRAAAPSRAPPSCRHLLRLTVPPRFDALALPLAPDQVRTV